MKAGSVLDVNEIQRILPHRYPFLLVDRIVELEENRRVVGIKNVSANEPFFAGHFPGRPVMPGVLLIEAMAQVGGVLMCSRSGQGEKLIYLAGIEKARFRRPVVPGDQVRFEVEVLRAGSRVWKLKGVARVDGELAVEAELLGTLADRNEAAASLGGEAREQAAATADMAAPARSGVEGIR